MSQRFDIYNSLASKFGFSMDFNVFFGLMLEIRPEVNTSLIKYDGEWPTRGSWSFYIVSESKWQMGCLLKMLIIIPQKPKILFLKGVLRNKILKTTEG